MATDSIPKLASDSGGICQLRSAATLEPDHLVKGGQLGSMKMDKKDTSTSSRLLMLIWIEQMGACEKVAQAQRLGCAKLAQAVCRGRAVLEVSFS
jgi:hypothetical protein